MTISFGEYGFEPEVLDKDGVDPLDWWIYIAKQAIVYFYYRDDYKSWVFKNFRGEENRELAVDAWDLLKLYADEDGEDPFDE